MESSDTLQDRIEKLTYVCRVLRYMAEGHGEDCKGGCDHPRLQALEYQEGHVIYLDDLLGTPDDT